MADQEYELDPDLQAFVEERLGVPFDETQPDNAPVDEDEEQTGEVGEEGEGGGKGDASQPVTEPPPPSDVIEVAPGVAITRDQALSYYEFDALLRGRPELMEEIQTLVRKPSDGGGGSPAPPPPLEIPEEYRDDPAFQAMQQQYAAQQEYLQSLQDRVQQLTDVTVTRDQEELRSIINTTKESFKTSHGLSNEEMDRIQQITERLNVIPSLLQGVDPVTGATEPRDRTMALNRAFEIALWYLPETREKEIARGLEDRAKATRRKQRLAGVSGGGGGSVSREADPRKMTEADRRAAMVREVAQSMGTNREE